MTKAVTERLKALAADRYWGEAEGRAALAGLEASGLSMTAFSRATGITARRLAWWRRRGAAEPASKIEFVPVEVARPARSASDGVMEVAIGDVRIRVGPGFDADALRRLLAVVAEPAC
jgi:hypothetical protein